MDGEEHTDDASRNLEVTVRVDDLMSFNSPAANPKSPKCLLPEKDNNLLLSPMVTISHSNLISSSSPKNSPVASSTPNTLCNECEEDPFELVERNAQPLASPWDIAEAQAAKFQMDYTANSNETSTQPSLNKGFIEDSSSQIPEILISSAGEKNPSTEDLDSERPPWQDAEESDSEDDLMSMIQNLSINFCSELNTPTEEPLSDHPVEDLALCSPNLAPLSPCNDIAFTSPPAGLKFAEFSSPDSQDSKEENMNLAEFANNAKKNNIQVSVDRSKGDVKKIPSQVNSKPLEVITNASTSTRETTKRASCLQQPRVYTNKENCIRF